MSSRRANGGPSSSMSRAEQIASGRLRMDRNPQHARINDPSLPAGRRKEIDNVMKRARAGSPGSWDRKLLEVEEKDPNRWRHTGYKQLYLEQDRSPSPRRSRSPRPARRSPPPVSTTTAHHPRRDNGGVPSHRRPEPPSSQPVVSSSRDRERERERDRERERERERDREREQRDTRGERPRGTSGRGRPPSPPPQRRPARSPIASSLSSCSDDSCSVCSMNKHTNKHHRSRSRSFSVPRSSSRPQPAHPGRAAPSHPGPAANGHPAPPPHHPPQQHGGGKAQRLTKPLNSGNANAGPSTLSLRRGAPAPAPAPPSRANVSSTKKPKAAAPPSVSLTTRELEANAAKKRTRDEKVLEWQRTQLAPNHKGGRPPPPHKAVVQPASPPPPPPERPHKLKTRIKKEGERPKKKEVRKEREEGAVSPGAIAAALAGDSSGEDDSSSEEDSTQHPSDTRLTLSERFGKMAQWSADRCSLMENMHITRRGPGEGGSLSVRIEERQAQQDEEPPVRGAHSPAPEGHYPEELLASAPMGMPCWDDVRVRYDYYKKSGYLRGLSLSDYIKWEEWWYRYQQWLKQERNYERWMTSGSRGGGGSHRRRRQH